MDVISSIACHSHCFLYSAFLSLLRPTLVAPRDFHFPRVYLIDQVFVFAGIFLTFRFATGFCGAAFLTVSGGSVSDMFPNKTVGTCVFSSISVEPILRLFPG